MNNKTKMKDTKLMTPNEMRKEIYNVIAKELKSLPETLNQLEPEERVKALTALMKFVDWDNCSNWGL